MLNMSACKTQEKAMTDKNPSTSTILINNEWQVIKTIETKENGSELVYQKPYKFSLNTENNRVSIKLEANRCHSTFTFSEDKKGITFERFGCTKMCCDSKEGTALTIMLAENPWTIENVSEKSFYLANTDLGVKVYLEKAAQIDEEFKQ